VVPLARAGVVPVGDGAPFRLHMSTSEDSTSPALAFVIVHAGPRWLMSPGEQASCPFLTLSLISPGLLWASQAASIFQGVFSVAHCSVVVPSLYDRSGARVFGGKGEIKAGRDG